MSGGNLIPAAEGGAATAQRARSVAIGHTSITWLNSEVEVAIRQVGELGFYGFETFPWNLEKLEAEVDVEEMLAAAGAPLVSAYCVVDLTGSSGKKEELEKAVRWARLIRRFRGRVFVVGPNSLDRAGFDFKAHKSDIVRMLNDLAGAVTDEGLTPVLHQHTGTCIETRDETYAVLDAANSDLLKFGPDVGQLTKGGADALQVVKDYLPIVEHVHLKDYKGDNPRLLGYCPLGQGRVNVPGILDLMEGRTIQGMIMAELDNDWDHLDLVAPVDLVRQSKQYLHSIGVKFRA